MVRVGRFGVAFAATAVVALGSIQPALAQEAATPPPDAAATEPPPAATQPPPPPADPPAPEPAPEPQPEPAPPEPPAESEPPPAADPPDATAPAPDDTAGTDSEPAGSEPAAAEATEAPKDVVKLEEAPAPAPAAPAPSAPAAAAPQSAPAPAAPVVVTIVLQDIPASPAAAAESPAANADAVDAAVIVSFRPSAAASPISLLPATEEAVETPRVVRTIAVTRKLLAQRQTCARPTARVPLSVQCKQARAVARMHVTLTYMSSPAEVRAAIARGPTHVTIRKVDEARPPPKSKAAKKHPVAEVRPVVPFGSSGQGAANDGFFSSSPGSTSSSRLFALAAVPLRVPWPFRFARVRVPSTRPHGVIPAPPSARPG